MDKNIKKLIECSPIKEIDRHGYWSAIYSTYLLRPNNPTLKFESTNIRRKEGNTYDLDGTFTIRGVEKPITLKIEFTGTALDLYGQRKAGFEISGTINRNDFGLTWNATTEDGGLALAEEVQLAISAQMIKQA